MNYHPYHETMTGVGPNVTAETNYTFDYYGYDVNGNVAKTEFIITVTPNDVCVPRDQYNVTCNYDEFCSFTVLGDMFQNVDADPLVYKLKLNPRFQWLKFSTFNHSFYGVSSTKSEETDTIYVIATDPFNGSCELAVVFTNTNTTSASETWLFRLGIIAAILFSVVMAGMVIHCIFIGGKWNAILKKYLTRKGRFKDVQHKINMQRYKQNKAGKRKTRAQKKVDQVKRTARKDAHDQSYQKPPMDTSVSISDWARGGLDADPDLAS